LVAYSENYITNSFNKDKHEEKIYDVLKEDINKTDKSTRNQNTIIETNIEKSNYDVFD